ncbi:hypothetical protein FACS1894132_12340 [Clostridia bacterium]|nr:hypothetical protein FACS1894132_12340 [Clostridia bacterium]
MDLKKYGLNDTLCRKLPKKLPNMKVLRWKGLPSSIATSIKAVSENGEHMAMVSGKLRHQSIMLWTIPPSVIG